MEYVLPMRTPTERWFFTVGWKLLNLKIIELTGNGIGFIPIRNLDVVPETMDFQELSGILKDDGLPSKYENGECWVWIR